MKIFLDGYSYILRDITKEEMQALKRMILSACLNERRVFNNLKEQIEHLEKKGFL